MSNHPSTICFCKNCNRNCSFTQCGITETNSYFWICDSCADFLARTEDIIKGRVGVFTDPAPNPVNHPSHYLSHPSGVECIAITEHMNFCLGNAIKYIWRAGKKGSAVEDLRKARWYLDREIKRLGGEKDGK